MCVSMYVSEIIWIYSALSSRIPNALEALVSRANKYVLRTHLKQSALIAGPRIKFRTEFQSLGLATRKAGRP